jgi:hypothetical protein
MSSEALQAGHTMGVLPLYCGPNDNDFWVILIYVLV